MSSDFRKRGGELRRKRPFRDVRPKIVVLCEGAVTEPTYLRGFCAKRRTTLVEIWGNGGCAPKTLVEQASAIAKNARKEALRLRDANIAIDEIWCVFDVDDHPRLQEAKIQAQANDVRLAVSNPCFELWIILHFREQSAFIDRHSAKSACNRLVPGQREKTPGIEQCDAGYQLAVERATALERRNESAGQPGENPSTTVHMLTERIRSASQST